MTSNERPTAYVMDSDPQALSVVRNLGRHGIPVVTLTYKPHSPGRFSRYATAHVLPRIDEKPDVWLDHLVQEGKHQIQRSVLFPCTDRFVEFVAKHRDALTPHYVIPLPASEVLANILDKRSQYRLAEQAGIPLPRTVFPRQESDIQPLKDNGWRYPCIIKPAKPHLWIRSYENGRKLLFAQSYDELLLAFRDTQSRGLDVVIQEYIGGGPESLYSLYFYADTQGELLCAGVGKKLRQFPINAGNGTMRVSVLEPRIIELSRCVIRAFKFHGVGNVEFRLDPCDGEFKLMELNTRTALGEEVITSSGLHIPYIAYRDLIGQPLPAQFSYKIGVKWWYLETDFRAFKELRKLKKLTFMEWIRSILGSRSFAYFAWDDLRPGIEALRKFIWKLRNGII